MRHALLGNQKIKHNFFNPSIHSLTPLTIVGKLCLHCDCKFFPPRDVCPNCGEKTNEFYAFSGKGKG